jgi:hypothetical protein
MRYSRISSNIILYFHIHKLGLQHNFKKNKNEKSKKIHIRKI